MYQLSVNSQFRWLRYILAIPLVFVISLQTSAQFESQIDSLSSVLDTTEDIETRCRIINDMARISLQVDPSSAHQYALQARDLALSIDLPLQKARSLNYLGASALMMAQYEEGLTYFVEAKEAFLNIGDEKGAADVIGNMGYFYVQKGNYDQALDIEFEALSLFEKVNDTMGLCNTNQLIANIFMETGNFEQALKYDSVALSCFISTGDRHGEAMVLGNLANIFSEQGELEKAKSLQLKAINIFEEIESPLDMARELGNLSTTYEAMGELELAISTTERSMEIFKNTNYEMAIPVAEGNLGAYYLTSFQLQNEGDTTAHYPEGDPRSYLENARRHLQSAYDKASSDRNVVFSGWLSEKLADTYELLDNAPQALYYYKIADEIQDSVYSMETKAEIEKLTTQREIELRDKQIELDRLAVQKKRNERVYFILGLVLLLISMLLIYKNYIDQKKSNAQLSYLNHTISSTNTELEAKNFSLGVALKELKETQDQLIRVEREKEKAELRSKISQDIHDDISSNLTKISWFSEMLQMSHSAKDLDSLGKFVSKINKSAKDTAAKLGEIIWSTSPSRDNLESLLSYMRHHAKSFFESTEFIVHIDFPENGDNLDVHPEVRRNLFLVFKEALNNAFKYSEGTSIHVQFLMENDLTYRLQISDNGKGIENTTSSVGGHGLKNMEKRIEDIKGSLVIESNRGRGTSITCMGPLLI